jgi:hypothetical protein
MKIFHRHFPVAQHEGRSGRSIRRSVVEGLGRNAEAGVVERVPSRSSRISRREGRRNPQRGPQGLHRRRSPFVRPLEGWLPRAGLEPAPSCLTDEGRRRAGPPLFSIVPLSAASPLAFSSRMLGANEDSRRGRGLKSACLTGVSFMGTHLWSASHLLDGAGTPAAHSDPSSMCVPSGRDRC